MTEVEENQNIKIIGLKSYPKALQGILADYFC